MKLCTTDKNMRNWGDNQWWQDANSHNGDQAKDKETLIRCMLPRPCQLVCCHAGAFASPCQPAATPYAACRLATSLVTATMCPTRRSCLCTPPTLRAAWGVMP